MLRKRKRKSGIIKKNIKIIRKNVRKIATPIIGETEKQRLGFLGQKKGTSRRVKLPRGPLAGATERLGLLSQTTTKKKAKKRKPSKKKTTKRKTSSKKKKTTKKSVSKKLPKMAEKYAKKMAKTTGLSLSEVKKSKPFKAYVKALIE